MSKNIGKLPSESKRLLEVAMIAAVLLMPSKVKLCTGNVESNGMQGELRGKEMS